MTEVMENTFESAIELWKWLTSRYHQNIENMTNLLCIFHYFSQCWLDIVNFSNRDQFSWGSSAFRVDGKPKMMKFSISSSLDDIETFMISHPASTSSFMMILCVLRDSIASPQPSFSTINSYDAFYYWIGDFVCLSTYFYYSIFAILPKKMWTSFHAASSFFALASLMSSKSIKSMTIFYSIF